MNRTMTLAAEDNQIVFTICSQLASPNHVVDLELIAPATMLATPAIPPQDFQLEFVICCRIKSQPTSSLHTHAEGLASAKNCCCCGAERNPNDRRTDMSSTSGFPLSR